MEESVTFNLESNQIPKTKIYSTNFLNPPLFKYAASNKIKFS